MRYHDKKIYALIKYLYSVCLNTMYRVIHWGPTSELFKNYPTKDKGVALKIIGEELHRWLYNYIDQWERSRIFGGDPAFLQAHSPLLWIVWSSEKKDKLSYIFFLTCTQALVYFLLLVVLYGRYCLFLRYYRFIFLAEKFSK